MADDSYSSFWSSTDEGGEEAEHEELEVELDEKDLLDLPLNLSDEQIEQLVKKVQLFTTLSNLSQDDWTEEIVNTVRQFVLYPRNEILSVYFRGQKLEASLATPNNFASDIMCFTKECNMELLPENFHETVQFVSFSGSVETTILSISQHVFLPALLKPRSLPQGIRSDFLTKMYTFLSRFTEVRSKMQGYTAIFVPTEMRKYSPQEGAVNKELLKQLEGMLQIWINLIRVALNDIVITGIKDDRYPIDEINFWIYRYHVLSALESQLKTIDVTHIIAILMAAESTYISKFVKVQKEIQIAMERAKLNIDYLQILKDHCKELSQVKDPLAIPKHLPPIMYKCYVIWKFSPYYNSKEQISGIFRNLSNLVILLCRKSVVLSEILKGHSALGLRQLQACIHCLQKYKVLFEKIAEIQTSNFSKTKELDKGLIFNHVDSFIRRCQEMIEVCNAMCIFGRMTEAEKIAKPIFIGTHGQEFEQTVEKVEKSFQDTLEKVKSVQDAILDVQNPVWENTISCFNEEVKGMEVMIENMITFLFAKVTNVEEGLQNLQAVYHYSKRPALMKVYGRSVENVYEIFGRDIEDARKDIFDENLHYPSSMPFYCGRATIALLKKNGLIRLNDLLESAKWLPTCAVGSKVKEQYRRVCGSIDDFIQGIHDEWMNSLATEEILPRLERPLLCHSLSHSGLIEPNLDRKLLTVNEEIICWKLMKFTIPKNIARMMAKLRDVKLIYENVLTLCMDYNSVISRLSPDERFLFQEPLGVYDRKFQLGFNQQTWASEGVDSFIADCFAHTTQLHKVIDVFKDANMKILHTCEKICDSSMVHFKVTEPYTVETLQEIFDTTREKVMNEIISYVQDIEHSLVHIYEGFEEHYSFMRKQWSCYILRIDSMVEEALIISIRRSLSILLAILHGDGMAGPSSFINISVTLSGKKIVFDPLLKTISETILKVLPNCVNSLAAIPRIYEKYEISFEEKPSYSSVVFQDKECRKLQEKIVKELKIMVQEVQIYLQRWEPFREVWEVDKDIFIRHYEEKRPSVADFDSDIARYTETSHEIRVQESVTHIHFLIINASILKDTIVDHCSKWQKEICDLLFRIFTENLNNHYSYMEEYSIKAVREPCTLLELQDTLVLHKKLTEEVALREKEFPTIQDQFTILCKYDVNVPEDLIIKLKNLEDSWQKYLEILDKMFLIIEKSKERFKCNLIAELDEFKKETKELLREFHDSDPFGTVEDETDGQERKDFRKIIKELRDREEDIRKHFDLFDMTLPANEDLSAIEKDLDTIQKEKDLQKL